MSFNSIPPSNVLGQTNMAIGLSGSFQVFPPRGCNGVYFGYQSGGSLIICNGVGATSTGGYVMGTSEKISLIGPVNFYLAAVGATAIAGILFSYSDGYSLQP